MYSARHVAIGTAGALALLAAIGAVGYSRGYHSVPDQNEVAVTPTVIPNLPQMPADVPTVADPQIPSDIAQACQKNYGADGGAAVTACDERLTAEQNAKYQALQDQRTREDAENISNYGTTNPDQIAKINSAIDRLDRLCPLRLLKSRDAWLQCERAHDPAHIVVQLWN